MIDFDGNGKVLYFTFYLYAIFLNSFLNTSYRLIKLFTHINYLMERPNKKRAACSCVRVDSPVKVIVNNTRSIIIIILYYYAKLFK